MEITTKEFSLSPEEFARLLRAADSRRHRRIYVGFYAIAAVCLGIGLLLQETWLIVFVVGVTVALFAHRYTSFSRYANDPENVAFLQRRRYTITPDVLHCWAADGTDMRTRIENVLRADQHGDIYRLYVVKHQFYYIPISAFKTEADQVAFETILRNHGLLDGDA